MTAPGGQNVSVFPSENYGAVRPSEETKRGQSALLVARNEKSTPPDCLIGSLIASEPSPRSYGLPHKAVDEAVAEILCGGVDVLRADQDEEEFPVKHR